MINKQQRKEGLLLGSFVADALSLGAHWVYDVEKIKKDIPDLKVFSDPLSIYHPEKKAGDFTHYGDMSLFLLSFIKDYDFSHNAFEKDLSNAWSIFMSDYKGYLDHSNRESLENHKKNIIPSGQTDVSDISPSSRIAPFVYKFIDNQNELLKYSQTQTIMTNNTVICVQSTIMTLAILQDIFNGLSPKEAIKNTLNNKELKDIHQYIQPALDSKEEDQQAILKFGQSCTIDGALPSALFFISKYENDFEKALIQNISCGGDSASRGMLIGMILGAYLGVDKIPKEWIASTKNINTIKTFI